MKNIKIFCDFDGTISINDIGDLIFKEFGDFENNISKLKNREINIKEYWNKVFSSLKIDLTINEIKNLIDKQDIDKYFIDFYQFCKKNNIDLLVVSDGYDIYIQNILVREIGDQINYSCNYWKYDELKNKHYPVFYGESESCHCYSASCKRNVVLNNSDDDDITVYIGDGYSDYCAAEHCDIIFAKKNLAAYCNLNKIPHFPFKSFFDIKSILIKLINDNKLKKRRQAILNRNSAFLCE